MELFPPPDDFPSVGLAYDFSGIFELTDPDLRFRNALPCLRQFRRTFIF
jgi:hypothetical protein